MLDFHAIRNPPGFEEVTLELANAVLEEVAKVGGVLAPPLTTNPIQTLHAYGSAS